MKNDILIISVGFLALFLVFGTLNHLSEIDHKWLSALGQATIGSIYCVAATPSVWFWRKQ